jgi:hypothetical protein
MFTLTLHDERVYRRLMERVEQGGETLDAVLLELLEQEHNSQASQENTPALKLLKLIDAAELPFEQPFDARDADEMLRRETGDSRWRTLKDDDGSA